MTQPRTHDPGPRTYTADIPQRAFGDGVRVLLRHPRLVAGVPMVVVALAVAYALAQPRAYSATASFMGTSSNMSAAGLSNLAAQFGFRMPTADASQSPQFYADLLASRQMLREVVDTQYVYELGGRRMTSTLVEAFEVSGATPAIRIENAVDALEQRTTTGIGRETGVVRVSVQTHSPELSAQIVNRYISLLNQFNLETRQSRATSERKFTEARLRDVQAELRASQDRLKGFRRANRVITGSPELQTEEERLAQDVMMRQQVYTTIMQAYEQARIDEVRDTPMITIVESASVPVRPDRRGLLRVAIFGAVLGTLLGTGAAVISELAAQRGFHIRRKGLDR